MEGNEAGGLSWLAADYQRYKPAGRATVVRITLLALIDTGFRAVVFYRLARACRVRRLRIFPALIDRLNFHLNHCSINSMARIGPGFRIAHAGGIVIGGKAHVGANFDIRQNTTLGGNMGRARDGDPSWTQPRVGDDVLVGCHAAILGPIEIGAGARIGACALVIADVESGAIVGGVPAKRIGVSEN